MNGTKENGGTEQESDSVYSGNNNVEVVEVSVRDGDDPLDLDEEHSTDESKTNSTDSKRHGPTPNPADSKETRWVRLTKMVVITFLVLACISSAAVTYLITSNAERNNFEQQVRH